MTINNIWPLFFYIFLVSNENCVLLLEKDFLSSTYKFFSFALNLYLIVRNCSLHMYVKQLAVFFFYLFLKKCYEFFNIGVLVKSQERIKEGAWRKCAPQVVSLQALINRIPNRKDSWRLRWLLTNLGSFLFLFSTFQSFLFLISTF